MNEFDPSAPEMAAHAVDKEFSVEEVAQMERVEMPVAAVIAASGDGQVVEGKAAAELVPIRPVWRGVSGRYRSCRSRWELVLRVDVDGLRPMKRLSGDYFRSSGTSLSYFGSFVVDALKITVSSSMVTLEGLATTTWPTGYNRIKVVIPRHTIFMPRGTAHVQWMTPQGNHGASYICVFESRFFRTVDLEQDHEVRVEPFAAYDTGSLPSGGPGRALSVVKSYAEAGTEMRTAGTTNAVALAEAGADMEWSNAELHNAMENHFSLWKNAPQWKVWLFHAMRHEIGPGLLGIMFDQKGKQRQGCAVFYHGVGGKTAAKQRDQLYTCVHELGHCFNLYHSFHKTFMDPPKPNRLSALSWMNYPWRFPGGAGAYWSGFPFQFDNLEVVHLRHAYRNNIIIGGNPFGTGAALEDPEAFADLIEDNSGLQLELEAAQSLELGEPVVVEIKLYLTDARGKRVHSELHPNYGSVRIAIQKPGGEVIVYQPFLEHCMETSTLILDEHLPSIYESAYIGYDRDRGQIFDQPGRYKLRAIYYALDGSVVLSDVMPLWVKAPVTAREAHLAELFLGEEQGKLLYLLGSDSPYLARGRDAFDLVLDKYEGTRLHVYAQLITGYNLSRQFVSLTPDLEIEVREPQYEAAEGFLTAVIKASEKDKGVDNITLNQTMRRLATMQIAAGNGEGAKSTMDQMVSIFDKKNFQAHVMDLISVQAEEVKSMA